MTLHRSISFALITYSTLYAFSPTSDAAEVPDRLMQGTIYYDAQAHGNAAAYSRVQYYRANGHSNDNLLEILELEYALKAGLSSTSQLLLDSSQDAPLSQEHRDRLNFVLARHAYKNKDWLALASRYSQISKGSKLTETTTGIFLALEMARVTGSFDTATTLLEKLPDSHILRRYGQFNLAAALYDSGDGEKSLKLLDELTDFRNTTFEQLMLAQRSQLILGQIALQQGRYEEASRRFSGISARGLYGDVALVALAQLKLADEQPERAIDIWHHVTSSFPPTSRTRVAYLGLAYATEQYYGPASALVEYTNLAMVLNGRNDELGQYMTALDAMDIESLVQASIESDTSDATSALLQNLLSDQSNRATAEQWRQLSHALLATKTNAANISILRAIDAEQVRRAEQARNILQKNLYAADLTRYQELITDAKAADAAEITTGFQPDQIPRLASNAEKEILSQLFRLREQFAGNGIKKPKIDMMIGKVQYDVYSGLPIRIQEKQAAAEKLLSAITEMRSSINRINAAAGRQGDIQSISQQLEVVDIRASHLMLVAEQKLNTLGDHLIANLKQSILLEQELVRRDLVEVNLAVVRIKDSQLLTMSNSQ